MISINDAYDSSHYCIGTCCGLCTLLLRLERFIDNSAIVALDTPSFPKWVTVVEAGSFKAGLTTQSNGRDMRVGAGATGPSLVRQMRQQWRIRPLLKISSRLATLGKI